MRVAGLAGMEHGVLAIGGCAAAIAVLVSGAGNPPADFTIPWAVLPIPGFLIAFGAAERYQGRFNDKPGWRGRLGTFLDSIHLITGAGPADHDLGQRRPAGGRDRGRVQIGRASCRERV